MVLTGATSRSFSTTTVSDDAGEFALGLRGIDGGRGPIRATALGTAVGARVTADLPTVAPVPRPGDVVDANTSAATRAPDGAPARLQMGVVAAVPGQLRDVRALGGRVVRAEYTIATPLEEITAAVRAAAAEGIRLQPLVGWPDGTPAPDLTPLAEWARVLGPGGTLWANGSDEFAITEIELGNENSFSYKSGDVRKDEYRDLAAAYGRAARDAAVAINAANPRVGVLVELESGDTDSPRWVDGVLSHGGDDLVRLMRAPVIHAYGPDWQQEIEADRARLATWGVHIPYWMTEWGIATDNGNALTDNYGFPTDLSYDQAGALLRSNLGAMASRPDLLRQVLLYQLLDQRPHGATSDREGYFGLLPQNAPDKGAYTAAARDAMTRYL